ncbi:purine-nucleoside phosphorylase [Microbacter sp. GSS18]|nr:purine-nucleoside phosphorylase [Microbacter sp. GSS18]
MSADPILEFPKMNAPNDSPASPRSLARLAAHAIREGSGIDKVDLAVTLGSGWKQAAGRLGTPIARIPATEIPGFHAAAVAGHAGELTIIRTARGACVLVIGARTHLYEGHGTEAVVHGVRVAAALGAKILVLTNGAGGVTADLAPGQPVLISDHVNLTVRSPIVGANFVDLTDLYATRLRDLARSVAPSLAEGTYAQLPGPHYETPAEVRMLRTLGVDLVGMSTVLEAIAAREAGIEVVGLSLVTNLAAGIQDTPLNHAEVLESGAVAEAQLGSLLANLIDRFLTAAE